MTILDRLSALRAASGDPLTTGLSDDAITAFAARDPLLGTAVDEAVAAAARFDDEFPGLRLRPEAEQVRWLQERLVNFYADDAVNPYVALAARGP